MQEVYYYQQVAPLILPYLKDRPETLRHYPHGITGTSFYQKKAEHVPDWVRTEAIQHEKHAVDYIILNEGKISLLCVLCALCGYLLITTEDTDRTQSREK